MIHIYIIHSYTRIKCTLKSCTKSIRKISQKFPRKQSGSVIFLPPYTSLELHLKNKITVVCKNYYTLKTLIAPACRRTFHIKMWTYNFYNTYLNNRIIDFLTCSTPKSLRCSYETHCTTYFNSVTFS